MMAIEFNKDGSGIASFFDGETWERIPFANQDEFEIIAFRSGFLLEYTDGGCDG